MKQRFVFSTMDPLKCIDRKFSTSAETQLSTAVQSQKCSKCEWALNYAELKHSDWIFKIMQLHFTNQSDLFQH